MVTTSMEITWKANNFLDRIRTSEPLEKLQNVGRAKQKVHTKTKQIDKLEPTPRKSIHRRQKYPEKTTINPRRQTDSNKSTATMKNNFRINWFTKLIHTKHRSSATTTLAGLTNKSRALHKSWLRAGFEHRNHLIHWRQHQQIFYNTHIIQESLD